jgi:hypothetical protein
MYAASSDARKRTALATSSGGQSLGDPGVCHLPSQVGGDARPILDLDDDYFALAAHAELGECERMLGRLGVGNQDVQFNPVCGAHAHNQVERNRRSFVAVAAHSVRALFDATMLTRRRLRQPQLRDPPGRKSESHGSHRLKSMAPSLHSGSQKAASQVLNGSFRALLSFE